MKGKTDLLTNNTIEGLHALRLNAMATGVIEQREQPDYANLAFEDRLGLLVDKELLARGNRRLTRMLKAAKLKLPLLSRTSTSAVPVASSDKRSCSSASATGSKSTRWSSSWARPGWERPISPVHLATRRSVTTTQPYTCAPVAGRIG